MIAEFTDVPVVPYAELLRRVFGGKIHEGGPLWPDWDRQTAARFNRNGSPVDDEPAPAPVEAVVADPAAAWIGPVVGHFGHGIADFSTRIPETVSALADPLLVFASERDAPIASLEAAPGWFRQLMAWYRIPADRVRFVTAPTRFRRLHVVPQGEQQSHLARPAAVCAPSRTHLDCLDRIVAAKDLPRRTGPAVFVSRAGLASGGPGAAITGRFAGEGYLEEVFRRSGWEVLRPEAEPLDRQLRTYLAADRLVFSEGSALHGLQLLGRGLGPVDVLCRREHHDMARHLLAPRAAALAYHRATRAHLTYLHEDGRINRNIGLIVLDGDALVAILERLGLKPRTVWDRQAFERAVRGDVEDWLRIVTRRRNARTEASRREILDRLGKAGLEDLVDLADRLLGEAVDPAIRH